jgi:D-alanine-D-alanine ligase
MLVGENSATRSVRVKIGIAFDLKPKSPIPEGAPDDLHEEFDSPATVLAIADAIRTMGHTPIELGNGRELLQKLLADPPDLVFNLAEGMGTSRNREARVPAVCEMLQIPHTGSDVLTLALCLDKDMARRIVQQCEVVVPNGILITSPDGEYDGDFHEFVALATETGLTLPLIAKPVSEGSSKGIRSKCLIERAEEIGPVVVSLWNDYKQGVLLEEFISGEEVTVGVVGNDPPRILGAMRVVPKQPSDRFVYSLEVKRDWEARVTYECPPKLPKETLDALETAALSAYESLGCRDVARIDFRIREGVPYFIEANPLPGLNPDTGDLLLICKAMGVTHAELIAGIVTEAMERNGLS